MESCQEVSRLKIKKDTIDILDVIVATIYWALITPDPGSSFSAYVISLNSMPAPYDAGTVPFQLGTLSKRELNYGLWVTELAGGKALERCNEVYQILNFSSCKSFSEEKGRQNNTIKNELTKCSQH